MDYAGKGSWENLSGAGVDTAIVMVAVVIGLVSSQLVTMKVAIQPT